MDDVRGMLAIGTAILGIVGVIVALTRYLTKTQEQGQRDAIAHENRELSARLKSTEAQRDQLLEQLTLVGKVGGAALARKLELDEALRSVMKALGASRASLYVPVRGPGGNIDGLAFLCIEPFSLQTQQLKAKIIPLKSLAGGAFLSGISSIVPNVAASADHFKPAETIVGYKPSTMLNCVLNNEGGAVGVLQFMRKEGEAGFEPSDLERVKALTPAIVKKLVSLTRNGEHLPLLGLAEDAVDPVGTILFFDLSGSTTLLRELSPRFALQLLNEYFEEMGNIAMRAGGTIDNYTGDGALLRFNLPRKQADHEFAAVSAAVAMNHAFATMRAYWETINPHLATLHNRIGISTGPLLQANLGHSQAQRLTVLGYPISIAASLCNAGPRDRSVILISAETHAVVSDRIVAKPIELAIAPKAARLTSGCYLVEQLR